MTALVDARSCEGLLPQAATLARHVRAKSRPTRVGRRGIPAVRA